MQQVIQLIHQYGVLAVCVSVLLEDSGLPFPSYPVLLVASAFTLTSLTAPLVLIAAVAAAMCADTVWYFAGKRLGPRIMRVVARMSFSPDNSVRRIHSWFTRVGPWALLMVKFLPGIALATIVFSGVTRLRLSRFLIFDAVGSAIYLGLPLALGRVFHDAIGRLLIYFARSGQVGIIVLAVLVIPYVITRLIMRRTLIRKLSAARVSAEQLMQMSGNPAGPVILEIRAGKDAYLAGSVPGARQVTRSGITAAVKQVPRNTDIVIYAPADNLRMELIAARVLEKAGFKKVRPLRGGIKAWIAAGCPVEFHQSGEPEPAHSALIVPFPRSSTDGKSCITGPRKAGP